MFSTRQLMDRVVPQELLQLLLIVNHVSPAREQDATALEYPGTLGEQPGQVRCMVEDLANVYEVDRLVTKGYPFSNAHQRKDGQAACEPSKRPSANFVAHVWIECEYRPCPG